MTGAAAGRRLSGLAGLCLLAAVLAVQARAGASEVEGKDDGGAVVLPADKPVLFVAHATRMWDRDEVAKAGITVMVREFLAQGWPVVYLNDFRSAQFFSYLPAALTPTADIQSGEGHHKVRVPTRHIFVTGGYADREDGCARRAVLDALASAYAARLAAGEARPGLVLHLPLDALYHSPRRTLEFIDPSSFFDDYLTTLSVGGVEHGLRVAVYDEDRFLKVVAPPAGLPQLDLIVRVTRSASFRRDPAGYDRVLNPKGPVSR